MKNHQSDELWILVDSYVKGDFDQELTVRNLKKENYLNLMKYSKETGKIFHLLPQDFLTIMQSYAEGRISQDKLRNWGGFIFYKVFVPFNELYATGHYESDFYSATYTQQANLTRSELKYHKPMKQIDIKYVYETNEEVDDIICDAVQRIESIDIKSGYTFTTQEAQEVINNLNKARTAKQTNYGTLNKAESMVQDKIISALHEGDENLLKEASLELMNSFLKGEIGEYKVDSIASLVITAEFYYSKLQGSKLKNSDIKTIYLELSSLSQYLLEEKKERVNKLLKTLK